jgi:hypothetical protein
MTSTVEGASFSLNPFTKDWMSEGLMEATRRFSNAGRM